MWIPVTSFCLKVEIWLLSNCSWKLAVEMLFNKKCWKIWRRLRQVPPSPHGPYPSPRFLPLALDPACEPGVNLTSGISESRGEFPVFNRLVHESVMHLINICFKLESRSVTVFPLERRLNTSRVIVMLFVCIFPGVLPYLRSCLLFIYDIPPGPL